ncbi:hypothetical protein DPMN_041670 [Dreissena polymorpha]|uniref:C-type lectin domain-containing protein n=1 Tax=Dreissena polymorpha TaxID=45954 RepID=A0A9D4CXD1_DREPO|nr:hypothetical protein DPMN_041670 [Dreissena polymorpha]
MAEQFSGAARYCEGLKSKLLHINDEREDLYIQRTLKKKYKGVKGMVIWRTGGRSYNGTFQWHNGDAQMPDDMTYTKWEKGHPATYSSLALVYDRKNDIATSGTCNETLPEAVVQDLDSNYTVIVWQDLPADNDDDGDDDGGGGDDDDAAVAAADDDDT